MDRLSSETSSDQLEEEAEAAPKLLITQIQIEGGSVTNPIILRINEMGLEGSLRNVQDGITYIGSELYEGDHVVNDFVIPENKDSLGRQHLMIRYNPLTRKYLIKDSGEGSGTFLKLTFPIQVKDCYIFAIGESKFIILLDQFS